MQANNSQYDIGALATALGRLLNNEFARNAINRRGGAASTNPPGSHRSTIGTLMRSLMQDAAYREVIARPHEVRDLQKFLRTPAVLMSLHADHELIVSVIGNQIEVTQVGWRR